MIRELIESKPVLICFILALLPCAANEASFFCISIPIEIVESALPKPIDLNNFDLSVKPSDDFYKYVNGNWLKNNPIPHGNSSWGTFSIVRQQQAEILKSLIEEIAKDNSTAPGSERQMIRDAFNLREGDKMVLPKNQRFTIW